MLAGLVFVLIGAAADPSAAPAAGFTGPASIGAPHVCPENQYPVSALQTGTEGLTRMAFTISPEGGVVNISVVMPSGNAALDDASVACARTWMYRPAMRNGVAVSAHWVAQVLWKINVSPPFEAISHASYRCMTADPANRDLVLRTPLHAVVRIHFSNGKFGAVTLVASSGDPDLDRKVVACYAGLPDDLAADIPGDVDELFVAMMSDD